MSLADGKINLNQYQCAQCQRTPTKSQELFHGCICGHRLFRIIRNNIPPKNKTQHDVKKAENMNFLTVQEIEVGRYNINVEKLLSDKTDKKTSSPVIVGNNGVFSIHLKPYKK
ncbi:MAG: hypothetical protein JSW11_08795 [Candidatus Heimdallarchaeota archaeon]|nr:MAG: hypothetical protein JSW11_08795 [Candidatus Heimdallarchaeota archaeon]